jgi:hypothetical protein
LQTVFTRKFWKSRKRITTESILGALVKDAELRMLEKQTGLEQKMKELLSHIKWKINVACQLILTIPSLCCSPSDRTPSQFGVESHPSLSKRYNSREKFAIMTLQTMRFAIIGLLT